MTPKKLPSEVTNLLNERISDEYEAHYFYRQVSNTLENLGYVKAAAFFKNEASDELIHAEGLQKYLVDWNNMPVLAPVSSPQKVTGLVDAIEKAYQIEYDLYESYEETSKVMMSKDLCTFVFLQEYMNIQRKSVAEYATLLNQLELIDKSDKNWVFNFEREIF